MFGTNTSPNFPIQLYHFTQPGATCEVIFPSRPLSSYIYYYWILRVEVDEIALPVIPDNATDLVMSPTIPGFSALYFPVTEKFDIPLSGPIVYTGVCFHTDHLVDSLGFEIDRLKAIESGRSTTESLGLEGLIDDIQDVDDRDRMKTVLDDFFERRIQTEEKAYSHWSQMGIFETLDMQDLHSMAAKIGLSERQFRRVATKLFGLSPKKIHRIVRLQSALSALFYSDLLKVSAGYYDDSHMFREFKELLDMSPSEVKRMAEKYNQKRN